MIFLAQLPRSSPADANINVVHPFNELQGADTYLNKFLRPLQKSFRWTLQTERHFHGWSI
jgi:hypothetical protein